MGDAANASRRRRLSSILLSRKPRLTDSTNKTTAKVESRDGLTMAVSFWMADPPQLSIFSIHCSKPPDSQDGPYSTEFSDLPHVVGVGAEGRFVLIRALFDRRATYEYFLYKAGEPPLLDRIPSPYEYYGDDGDDLRGVREFGVLQLGSHYLVAALCLAPSSDDYHLWIYSSERKSWSTRTLPNPCPLVHRIRPDKVITLGEEGLLGWVDLSHGLLMCDLRQDHSMSFIPLPEPLPGNRYKLHCPIAPPTAKRKKKLEDESHPNLSWFRDLACVDGVLKFIEMENVAPGNRSDKDDVIYDLDLIMSLERKAEDWNSKQLSFGGAWRAVTWTRTVSSNCWRQTCAADVADILVDDGSVHSSLLPGLGKKLTFRDLYSAFPILSPDGDDILYLKSVLEPSIQDGWVAAVDLGNKTVKAIGKYYLPDDFYYEFRHDPQHPFHACTLSRHLDMTPGIEVSACRKITEEASSSANHPSYTSIRVGELNSCEPRSIIQRPLDWTKKNKRARNAAGSIMQNDHISQVHPIENNLRKQLDEKVLELEREVERELGWKKEQKTQQQCFKKWDAPCYPPGHLLWPQNNLPAQQYFNKPDGPCGPGYASLASVHGRHNYQPLWQQPPPLKQQLTYSSEFRPHEVPQPSFNNRSGASYHWYSQQLSAPNSFAYGAHTGYGNYQHQWEQLPITLEMPIASWEHPPPPLLCHPTPSENPCAFQTEI